MSTYVRELQKRDYPEKMTCPHHGLQFKKNGKFWKCPDYWECGVTIGSRRLVGHVTTMWIRQTKKGQAWRKGKEDAATERWWDLFPGCFAGACYVAASWKP